MSIYIIIGFLILSLIVAFWSIIANRKSVFGLILVPFFLFGAYKMYGYVNDIMGYPIVMDVSVEYYILSVLPDFENDIAYLWVIEKGETIPRAFYIDLNKHNKRQLQRAKEAMDIGQSVPGKSRRGKNGETFLELNSTIEENEEKYGDSDIP